MKSSADMAKEKRERIIERMVVHNKDSPFIAGHKGSAGRQLDRVLDALIPEFEYKYPDEYTYDYFQDELRKLHSDGG